MVAVIIINGPGHDGTRLALQEGITSFGRLPSNDVVLLDDLVSRNHARITFFDGRVTLHDLGSHNGCYVNGERVKGPRLLQPGDLCRIGPFQLLHRSVAGLPPPEKEAAGRSSSLLQQIEAARDRTDDQPRALQVLLRATEALASAAELDDYVSKMLRLALDQTGAERGAYVEPKPSGLEVVQVAGPDGPATDVLVSPAVVEWVVQKNYPIRVDDLADDLRFVGPSQALMCVPLSFGDEVLGAFHVARALPSFPPEALDTLIAVAHLAAVGIRASRARYTAVRARLARDTLARSFHPDVADALAGAARDDVQAMQATLLRVTLRDWPANAAHSSRTRLTPLVEAFCHRVGQQGGRWYVAPGPTLYGVFEDEAGPARAVAVVDDVRGLAPPPPTLRAAVVRGALFIGVATTDQHHLPMLDGPAVEAAERLAQRVPPGGLWLDDAAARIYPGPKSPVARGAFVPT